MNIHAHIKKVAIIIPDTSSGMLIRGYLIKQILDALEIPSDILGFNYNDKVFAELHGSPIINMGRGYLPSAPLYFLKTIVSRKYDCLYAIKPRADSFGLALLAKHFLKKTTVLDIDDDELSWVPKETIHKRYSLQKIIKDLILRRDYGPSDLRSPIYGSKMIGLIDKADALSVSSLALQKKYGGTYIANGLCVKQFNPSLYDPQMTKRELGLSQYKLLMFAGSARPYKGLEDVIAALEIIEDPSIRLAIIGSNSYDNYQSELIQKHPRWIIELPAVSYSQIPRILSIADIVVVPQRDHPTTKFQFPLKLTNAMAMAKPIISTKVGPIPEIVGETAYLVDPNNPKQLAEIIISIFNDPEKATNKGLGARKRCVEFYDIETLKHQMASLLSTICRP